MVLAETNKLELCLVKTLLLVPVNNLSGLIGRENRLITSFYVYAVYFLKISDTSTKRNQFMQ